MTECNRTIQFNSKTKIIIVDDEDWNDDSYASSTGLSESFSMDSNKRANQNKPYPSTIFSIPPEPDLSQKVYVAGLIDQYADDARLISHRIANQTGLL